MLLKNKYWVICSILFLILFLTYIKREKNQPFEIVDKNIVIEQRPKRELTPHVQSDGKLVVTDFDGFSSRISLALREADREVRWSSISEIAHDLAVTDPYAAFAWAASLENVIDRQTAMTGVYLETLNAQNLKTSLDILSKIPQGDFRDHAIVMGIGTLASKDLQEALKLTEQISGQGMVNSAARILSGMITSDQSPLVITEIMNNLPYGEFRSLFAKEITAAMAKENPKRAIEWLLSQNNLTNTGDAIRQVAIEFAKNDPLDGLATATRITDTIMRAEFLNRLGQTWARESPKEAGEWLTDLVKSSGYDSNSSMANGILEEWIQWDHDMPFKQIEKIHNEVDKNKLLLKAAVYLGNFDPEAAAEKIGPFVNIAGKDSARAYRSLAENWIKRDSVQASSWIADLPPGTSRDVTIEVLVENILKVDSDPALAMEWANQIQSDQIRKTMQNMVDRY